MNSAVLRTSTLQQSPKRSRVYLKIQIESSWCFNQTFPEPHTLFQGPKVVPLQLQSSSDKNHKGNPGKKCSPVTLEQQENLKIPRAFSGHQAGSLPTQDIPDRLPKTLPGSSRAGGSCGTQRIHSCISNYFFFSIFFSCRKELKAKLHLKKKN